VGVCEYWIIDRFRRILTVVRQTPDGPREQIVSEGETYTTPLVPGFELPLKRLLALADRWEEGARKPRRKGRGPRE
jgi:Uma2 family endonuclease